MSEMTPTERVRAELDMHGVEWMSRHSTHSTFVKTSEGNVVELYESGVDGKFIAYNLTPEQAAKVGCVSGMTPIPNRLTQVPKELHEDVDMVLENEVNYDQTTQTKRLHKVVDTAYRHGYMDGYRDGHTDAENGHDERVRVSLA